MARILPRSGKTARCARQPQRGLRFHEVKRRQMEASRRSRKRPAVSSTKCRRRHRRKAIRANFPCSASKIAFPGVLRSFAVAAGGKGPSGAFEQTVRFRAAKCHAPFCAARVAFVSGAPVNEIYRVRTRHAAVRRASRLFGFAQRNAAHRFARQGHGPTVLDDWCAKKARRS